MENLTSDFSDNRKNPRRLKGLFVLGLGALAVAGVIAGGFWLFSGGLFNGGPEDAGTGTAGKLPSEWLVKYFGTDDLGSELIGGLRGDPDQDLLHNFQEFMFNTDPTDPDTDGDGQYDGVEVAVNSNPNGGGKLYISDQKKEFVEEFAQTNQLDEFTEDGVTQVLSRILTSASAEDVEVPLIDVGLLNVITDESPEGATRYIAGSERAVSGMLDLASGLDPFTGSVTEQDSQILVGRIYEALDELRDLPVPVAFVSLHQLQIAALQSTAFILESLSNFEHNSPLESQVEKTQSLSYQLQVLQNTRELIEAELVRLSERYPAILTIAN